MVLTKLCSRVDHQIGKRVFAELLDVIGIYNSCIIVEGVKINNGKGNSKEKIKRPASYRKITSWAD